MVEIEKNLTEDFIDSSVCDIVPTQPIRVIRTHITGQDEGVELTSCRVISQEGICTINGETCTRRFITPHDTTLLRQYTTGNWPENKVVS